MLYSIITNISIGTKKSKASKIEQCSTLELCFNQKNPVRAQQIKAALKRRRVSAHEVETCTASKNTKSKQSE